MSGRDFNDEDKRKATFDLVNNLAKLIQSCDGIEVDDYNIDSEDFVPLTRLREMYFWPLDFLSLAPDSDGLTPVS